MLTTQKQDVIPPIPGEELLPSVAPGNALSPEGGVPGGVLSSLPESPSDDLCEVH